MSAPALSAGLARSVGLRAFRGCIHGPADPGRAERGCTVREHYAVLDVAGDIIGDWCVPDRAAWDRWARAVELRATVSDCPDDEPAAWTALHGPGGIDETWRSGR